ncbi:hypothetical protein GGH12_000286 [Coemansia sp. RSA 1822]|nr:hypothetical protein GGH12_000286 [Coemansia sp. RSA 1822]
MSTGTRSISSFDTTSTASDQCAPSTACASTTHAESIFDSNSSQAPSIDTALRTHVQLGDIAQQASRLSALRLSNQDFTPMAVRRLESLQRVDELMSVPRERERESLLKGIAVRLARLDTSDMERSDRERNVHPRDHMRRILVRSIDRLHRLGSPSMHTSQRYHRQPLTN